MYTPKQVAALFNCQRETVRRWAMEFEAYLSPTASPGKNRDRSYTDSDLAVFALVSQMKAEGKLFTDIHASLANGSRGIAPQYAIVPTESERVTLLQSRITELEASLLKKDGQLELYERQLAAAHLEIRALVAANAVLKARPPGS